MRAALFVQWDCSKAMGLLEGGQEFVAFAQFLTAGGDCTLSAAVRWDCWRMGRNLWHLYNSTAGGVCTLSADYAMDCWRVGRNLSHLYISTGGGAYTLCTVCAMGLLEGGQEFVDKLHETGRRFVPILDPGIAVEPGYKPYDEGIKRGVFIRDITGEPYIGEVGFLSPVPPPSSPRGVVPRLLTQGPGTPRSRPMPDTPAPT